MKAIAYLSLALAVGLMAYGVVQLFEAPSVAGVDCGSVVSPTPIASIAAAADRVPGGAAIATTCARRRDDQRGRAWASIGLSCLLVLVGLEVGIVLPRRRAAAGSPRSHPAAHPPSETG